jgi:addiction module RelE/StbE family toxin
MKINYEKQFEKALKKLSSKIKDKFFIRLNIFLENKFSRILNNHSVDRVYPGCRSIDITGDYRAIFFDEGDIITFIIIGTHAQIYK